MGPPPHPAGGISDRASASSSQEPQSTDEKKRPAGTSLTRRKRILLAVLAGIVTLGLVLGLALGLTIGRRNASSSSTSSSNPSSPDDNSGPVDGPLTTAPPRGTHPNPHPITGTIPNNANWTTLDPTLVRRASDGKLFLYTTGGGSGYVWTSPSSLAGPWTKLQESMVPKGIQAGAPDVHRWNDTTYIMFHNSHAYNYSLSAGVTNPEAQFNWHDASIIARTSSTLEPGSWREVGRLEIDWAAKYNILDAALLRIPAGRNKSAPAGSPASRAQNLLSFGSYQTGLYQIPLDADFPVKLADKAMGAMTHLSRNETNKIDATEGTYMYYRADDSSSSSGSGKGEGWYYLFFSSGHCCPIATVHHNTTTTTGPHHNHTSPAQPLPSVVTTSYTVSGGATTTNDTKISWFPYDQAYRVMVCRSRTPRGDYVDRKGRSCLTQSGGTLVLGSHDEVFAPGGQGVVDDEVEGPVLYYHYVTFNLTTNRVSDTDKGYKFGWNKLDFSDQGWPRVV